MNDYWKGQLEQFKKNPILIVIALVLLAAFVYVFYARLVLYPKMEKEGRYTIGVTIETHKPPKGGTVIRYSVLVNNEQVNSSANYTKGVTVPGGRYLVKYLPSHPSVSNIYFDCPIPEEIKEVPPEGWGKPPFNCRIK